MQDLIPDWATHIGTHPGGHKLFYSEHQRQCKMKNDDEWEPIEIETYEVKDWEDCGWHLTEIIVDLENK